MPREIRVFSMSVLDLLTCALGGTILTMFLLIVSIQQAARPGGSPYAYFSTSAGVWVDVTAAAKGEFLALEKGAVWDELVETDGPFAADELGDYEKVVPALRGLPQERCEVELQLFHRPFGSKEKLGPNAEPTLSLTSATAAARLRGQPAARVSSQWQSLGLRRVAGADSSVRVYAAFRLDLAAFQITPGWYFLRLEVTKAPRAGAESAQSAAWLRTDTGGTPGAAWYQTHAAFAAEAPEWPAPRGFAAAELDAELPAHKKVPEGAASGSRMQRLQLPDIYAPGWPKGYTQSAPAVGSEFRFVAEPAPGGDGRNVAWKPHFALRVPRADAPTAGAARYPTFVGPPADQPGWHAAHAAGMADDFLPGFRIGTDAAAKPGGRP